MRLVDMSPARGALDPARRRAGLVLWIEQLWPAALPAFGVIGVYAVLSLLTVPQRLPPWLHALVLILVLAAAALLLRRGLRGLASPAPSMRDRRIEQASRLPHRPLSTLHDRPALAGVGDPAALLWQAHLQRTRAGLGRLQAGRPVLSLGGRDRNGAAPALLASFLVASLLSGRDAPLRLASGFWPGIALPFGPPPALQAWITPPDYAGGAPVFLTDPHGHYVVPAGARLTVSLTGSDATPRLSSGLDGHAVFARLSERSWSLDWTLPATAAPGARLRIAEAGHRLSDWRIVVQPSPRPEVAWTAPPGADTTLPWRTRLPWSAAQRYGVRSLSARITLAGPDGHGRVLTVPIALGGSPAKARGVAVVDLSADPWAGAKVTAHLVATDGSGQSAASADASFVLPARSFRNPLARAVLDIRRRLATGAESPSDAADDLLALGDTPGAFAQDSSLFLNLSSTASLLHLPASEPADAPNPETQIAEASDRLWTLALALEDGLHNDRATARAALDVRAAQDRLSAQIERMRQLGQAGQAQPEQDALKARIAALGAAIARKMQALAAQAARAHTPMPAMPDASALDGTDLKRMLKEMQDQAAAGHADAAMQALSRMQSMLDHMRLATPQDLQSAEQQAQATAQARDQMEAIQDLVKRQTALLDSTQSRLSAADRAKAAEQAQLQTDGEDAQTGGQAGGQAGDEAPDAATRALMRQLGIPDAPPDQPAAPAAPDRSAPPLPAQTAAQQDAARLQDRHAQTVLRRALDELGVEFKALSGKKADQLDTASREMQTARDALRDGKDADADAAQIRALAALQKGQGQMSAAMRGGRSGGTGLALLPGSGAGDDGMPDGPDGDEGGMPGTDSQLGSDESGPRDPLGRPVGEGHGGHDDGSETHIPGADNAARSRQIEQELRRRDSDRTRPQPELDYLDRLLKSF
jgi:uncharacterized protein (TIGR02302 family)